MKKLVKIFMLFSLVFVFTNCSNDDNKNNIVYYFDEPAVVESSSDLTIIQSAHDRFIVPSLGKDSLEKGDLLWTAFIVDMNKGKSTANPSCYEATDFRYIPVDSAKIIMPADTAEFNSYLSDDYTAFIYEAVLYPDYLDKLLFFGFKREKPSDDASFDYELIWNPEKEKDNSHPTLYIRSKKIDIAAQQSGHKETVFAFDMTEFINYYKKNISDKNPVYFNLKYKTGTDEDGHDIYRAFRSNPIMWQIQE